MRICGARQRFDAGLKVVAEIAERWSAAESIGCPMKYRLPALSYETQGSVTRPNRGGPPWQALHGTSGSLAQLAAPFVDRHELSPRAPPSGQRSCWDTPTIAAGFVG